MSCGKKDCRRKFKVSPSFCRCGLEFCSEACFIAEWHARHQAACPHAADIKKALAESRVKNPCPATKLLVACALSSRPPQHGQSQAGGGLELESQARNASKSSQEADVRGAAGSSRPQSSRGDQIDAARDAPTKPPAQASAAEPRPSSESSASNIGGRRSFQRFQLTEFDRVGDPIGSGSYGQVTKVIHKTSGDTYAMKAIPKRKIIDNGIQAYLMREVRTQLTMHHPRILRLYYYFEDASNVHLLLEYASGGSLFSTMRGRGRLPERTASRIFVDIAGALVYLHRGGIVHRDLKPENILMCANDMAKLADFGWCAELSHDLRNTFCGTFDYLSPEMIHNQPHDHTVDTWAAGILLYEMLVAKAPFHDSSHVKIMARITAVDLRIPKFVSDNARGLITSLVVREPKDRMVLLDALQHAWVLQQVSKDEVQEAIAWASGTVRCSAGSSSSTGGETSAPVSPVHPERSSRSGAPAAPEAASKHVAEGAADNCDADAASASTVGSCGDGQEGATGGDGGAVPTKSGLQPFRRCGGSSATLGDQVPAAVDYSSLPACQRDAGPTAPEVDSQPPAPVDGRSALHAAAFAVPAATEPLSPQVSSGVLLHGSLVRGASALRDPTERVNETVKRHLQNVYNSLHGDLVPEVPPMHPRPKRRINRAGTQVSAPPVLHAVDGGLFRSTEALVAPTEESWAVPPSGVLRTRRVTSCLGETQTTSEGVETRRRRASENLGSVGLDRGEPSDVCRVDMREAWGMPITAPLSNFREADCSGSKAVPEASCTTSRNAATDSAADAPSLSHAGRKAETLDKVRRFMRKGTLDFCDLPRNVTQSDADSSLWDIGSRSQPTSRHTKVAFSTGPVASEARSSAHDGLDGTSHCRVNPADEELFSLGLPRSTLSSPSGLLGMKLEERVVAAQPSRRPSDATSLQFAGGFFESDTNFPSQDTVSKQEDEFVPDLRLTPASLTKQPTCGSDLQGPREALRVASAS